MTVQDKDPIAIVGVGCLFPEAASLEAFWGNVEGQAKNAHYLDMLAETGCTWVRFQFAWFSLQPEPDTDISTRLWAYDQIIDMARQRDLSVLVNVTHAPSGETSCAEIRCIANMSSTVKRCFWASAFEESRRIGRQNNAERVQAMRLVSTGYGRDVNCEGGAQSAKFTR